MNTNPQQFTRKELADFYEKLILLWENGDLLNKKFNVRSNKIYRRLKDTYDFDIQAFSTVGEMKTAFEQHSPSACVGKNCIYLYNAKNNILKSYFYHIRNVAGHADIEKIKVKNVNWYIFKHIYSNQIKLFGQFKVADFWKVHEALVKIRSSN